MSHLPPSSLAALSLLALTGSLAQAQPILPSADGTQTQVTIQDGNFTIGGGTQAGANLFHSFEQFGLSTGQTAIFLGNPDLANILGRVTGGQVSAIDGLLQTQNTSANLYLMNPAGIVLGPNASLDLGGSFTATTATAIGFDGGWLSATGNADYATLVGSPNRFAFTGAIGGAIVNAANLGVNPGESLTLLGGTVVNTGDLSAPGGLIQLRAVPGERVVRLEQAGMVLALDVEPLPQDGDLVISTVNPLDLPALLTGGAVSHATALVVHSDGSVSLTSDGPAVPTGAADVAFAGTATVDAGSLGNGGQIQVMGENHLEFLGSVSARGGDLGGDGGLIDLSGKETLNLVGNWFNRVDLAAPQGIAGTLLFDPNDIAIVSGSAGGVGGSPASANTLGAGDISTFLNNTGSLVIATTGTGGSGDITLASGAAINWTSANHLTLRADRAIALQSGSSITSTSGNITLEANLNGTSTGNFKGILLTGGATLTTDSGAIALTGQGGDTNESQAGIWLEGASRVETTSGDITFIGTGGNTPVNNGTGIYLIFNGTVQSQDGNIVFQGTGSATGSSSSAGVGIYQGAQVRTTGAGNITIDGAAGVGTAATYGVSLFQGQVQTAAGDLTVTGTGSTNGSGNYGVLIFGGFGPSILASSSGNLNITGISTNAAGIRGSTSTIGSATGTGDISLIADQFEFASTTVQGVGNLTISPYTPGTNFTPGFANISAGFSSLTVGSPTAGTVNLPGTITLNVPTTVLGDSINVAGSINAGNNDLTFQANRNILLNSGASILLNNGNATFQANQGATVTPGAYNGVTLTGATLEATGTGNILLQGRTGDTSAGTNAGILLNFGALVKSNRGSITLQGEGVLASAESNGVLFDYGAAIETATGAITLTGINNGVGATGDGLRFTNGSQIRSTGTGAAAITLDGQVVSPVSVGRGMVLAHGGTGLYTVDGNVSLKGQGQSGFDVDFDQGATVRSTGTGHILVQSTNTGNTGTSIIFYYGASGSLQATGSGSITLEAARNLDLRGATLSTNTGNMTLNANTAGTTTGAFRGISLDGTNLTTASGAIALTGVGGNTGGSNHGIYQIGNSVVTTTTGAITYRGTSGVGTAGDNDGIRTEGAGTAIRSQNGDISLTGVSQGNTGGFNDGVLIHLNSTVETTGSGSVTIDGSATGLGGGDRAILTTGGTTIRTGTGNITLIGRDTPSGVTGLTLDNTTNLGSATTGDVTLIADTQLLGTLSPLGVGQLTIAPVTPGASFTPNFGTIPASFTQVTIGSATTGTVNLPGTATLNTPTTIIGQAIALTGSLGSTSRLTLNTNNLALGGSLQGTGDLAIVPLDSTTNINLGLGAPGTLDLDLVELGNLQDGFNSITIGRADSTGTVTLGTGITFRDPVLLAGGSTLYGPHQPTAWTLDAPGGGSLSGLGETARFANFEALIMGSADDSLALAGGSVANFIDAGAGVITLTGTNIDLTQLGNLRSSGNYIFNASNNLNFGNFSTGGTPIIASVGGIISGGTVSTTGSTAGSVNLSGNTVRLGTLLSGGNVAVGTTNELSITTLSSRGQAVTLSSNGGVNVATLSSAGATSVSGGGTVTIANLSSAGATSVSGGSVNLGALTSGGAVNLTSAGAMTTGNLTGGSLTANAGTTLVAANLNASGPINLASDGDLVTGNLLAPGQAINLTSRNGAITTGNASTASSTGGSIFYNARTAITAGTIDASGSVGNGGNVTLDPIGDVQVVSINAQGGASGAGGTVDITAGQFFRATGSFTDRNGLPSSISTVGGTGGGTITIRHGGGDLGVPFITNNPSLNGTLAALSTGFGFLEANRVIPGPLTESGVSLITSGFSLSDLPLCTTECQVLTPLGNFNALASLSDTFRDNILVVVGYGDVAVAGAEAQVNEEAVSTGGRGGGALLTVEGGGIADTTTEAQVNEEAVDTEGSGEGGVLTMDGEATANPTAAAALSGSSRLAESISSPAASGASESGHSNPTPETIAIAPDPATPPGSQSTANTQDSASSSTKPASTPESAIAATTTETLSSTDRTPDSSLTSAETTSAETTSAETTSAETTSAETTSAETTSAETTNPAITGANTTPSSPSSAVNPSSPSNLSSSSPSADSSTPEAVSTGSSTPAPSTPARSATPSNSSTTRNTAPSATSSTSSTAAATRSTTNRNTASGTSTDLASAVTSAVASAASSARAATRGGISGATNGVTSAMSSAGAGSGTSAGTGTGASAGSGSGTGTGAGTGAGSGAGAGVSAGSGESAGSGAGSGGGAGSGEPIASASGGAAAEAGGDSIPWIPILAGVAAIAAGAAAVATGAAGNAAKTISTAVTQATQALLSSSATANASGTSHASASQSGQNTGESSNPGAEGDRQGENQIQTFTQIDVSVDSQMEKGEQNIAVNKLGGATEMTRATIDLENQPEWDLASTAENLVTLGDIFGVSDFFGSAEADGDAAGSTPKDSAKRAAQAERRAALKAKLEEQASALPGTLTDYALGMVIEKLNEVLAEIEVVGDILAFAWSKSVELSEYYKEIQAAPGESFAVPLVNHEVVSEHAPSLELKLKEKAIGNLAFTVNCGVVVDGVLLEVEGGKITGIKIGNAIASGGIQMLGQSLLEAPEGELELPTVISLGEGIPLYGVNPGDLPKDKPGDRPKAL